ncbi:MAG: hypothetical protein EPO06_04150 [Burkholderiaceae bacterium]|nr:MAG: hypothetical protein EPO06_04150 [Burkholderiaceae bacterium]
MSQPILIGSKFLWVLTGTRTFRSGSGKVAFLIFCFCPPLWLHFSFGVCGGQGIGCAFNLATPAFFIPTGAYFGRDSHVSFLACPHTIDCPAGMECHPPSPLNDLVSRETLALSWWRVSRETKPT